MQNIFTQKLCIHLGLINYGEILTSFPFTKDVRFGNKVGQIGIKWGKCGTF